MSEILMVQILYYQHTPPSVLVTFWWSSEKGVTCDNPRIGALMKQEGIMLPGGRLVYPTDSRVFFDSLPFAFTGVERAQKPVVVDRQEGDPI